MPRFTRIAQGLAVVGCAALAAFAAREALTPAYDGQLGFSSETAPAAHRNAVLAFHLWYPAEPGGRRTMVGGNGVFYGTPAGKNAPPAAGKAPLVVISHGGGGNAGQMGWMAARLVEAGYTVAAPNHPGTTSGNASAAEAVKLWNRPQDISAVIDALQGDPERYRFVDTDAITALGFSAGGYTSMALAGARIDPDRIARFCDDGQTGMSDCAFLEQGGVDLHAIDFTPAARDLRDTRISRAAIIDPGIVSTLTEQSLAGIDIPMLILNLGSPDTLPNGVNAARAASQIGNATYQTLPGTWHFTFLSECKAKGADILAREGEPDRLCDEPSGQPRADLHAQIADIILGYLGPAGPS